MQEKSTFFSTEPIRKLTFLLICVLLALTTTKSYAQQFCADEIVFYFEDFGTGTSPTSHPDVLPNGLTYQATGSLSNEGVYRVINNTQQKPEWHNAPDHTAGDVNGKMLVINGQAESFFNHITSRPTGYIPGFYSASLYLLNVNTPGTCAPNPLLPIINFRVEYRGPGNNWIPLVNSPISSGAVPQTPNPGWFLLGAVFTLPATGNFTVTQIRIRLADGIVGGCGNDFALDDIKLASCPAGGPLPVTFLQVTVAQKGTGAFVNWATASEVNNNYFEVERSTNAGTNWTIVGNVKGAINSNVKKNYSHYDPKPVAGLNLYRIKQVDLDGRFKYSVTVNLTLSSETNAVSVLSNPFYSSIAVDFLSNRNQVVSCRLVDLSGKKVFAQQLSIMKGSSRKEFAGLGKLSNGLYVLEVTGDRGDILYKDKLLKR